MTVLGRTVDVHNLSITEKSGQISWSANTTLALTYADGAPPLNVNVVASYDKPSDTLKLSTDAGNPTATWGSQTITLAQFEYDVTPLSNPASGSETFTLKATGNLTFGPVNVVANITGVRATRFLGKSNITLTASGTALVDGVTISFDSLTFDGHVFQVAGNLKLPSQTQPLAFATSLDPATGRSRCPSQPSTSPVTPARPRSRQRAAAVSCRSLAPAPRGLAASRPASRCLARSAVGTPWYRRPRLSTWRPASSM